jgi:hypothetical protein
MGIVGSHQTVRLARGSHRTPQEGVCVMELASMLAGEPFSDRPTSVCRVLAAYLRACNDRFDGDMRQRLYRYASEAVGTAGDPVATAARAARCAEAASGRRVRSGFAFGRRRRVPALPEEPLGPRLEGFVVDVVRSYPRTAAGATALLALADELLALGRASAVCAGATPSGATTPAGARPPATAGQGG